MTNDLPIWTIYDHPSDYPDCFVARMFSVRLEGPDPDTAPLLGATLDEVRAAVQDAMPYVLHRIPRADSDDPVVVESWL